MRVIHVTILVVALALPLAGCSGAGDAAPVTSSTAPAPDAEPELLTPLWEHPLMFSVTGPYDQGAVSQGHLLASGTIPQSNSRPFISAF